MSGQGSVARGEGRLAIFPQCVIWHKRQKDFGIERRIAFGLLSLR